MNIRKLIQSLAKDLWLPATAVVGIGIWVFCSAYSVPEGCTPSVTVTADASAGSCLAAGVTATCVGDDKNDSVTAQNNQINNTTFDLDFVSDTGQTCDTTTWSNLVNIVGGVNQITATSSELGITSSPYDLTENSGYAWSYAEGGRVSCGFKMPITVTCLSPNTTTTYADYETPGSATLCGFIPDTLTKFPGNNKSTDANGTLVINDVLSATCPPYTFNCNASLPKIWHIYNRQTGGYLNDVTSSGDTVTFNFSTTNPKLTVSDSQCGPPQTFN